MSASQDQPASSARLAEAASQGDDGAFDDLIVRHLPALHAFVRLNAGPLLERKEGFSDLVQSACREALEDLTHFDHDNEAIFRSWLFTAAMRKIKDKLRYHRAQRRDALKEAEVPASGASLLDGKCQRLMDLYRHSATPSTMAMVQEDLETFEQIFAELPDDQRRAFILRRVVGLTYSEIASDLGKAEDAVRKLYSRSAARLLTALSSSS